MLPGLPGCHQVALRQLFANAAIASSSRVLRA
jgi:hypothetical protein